MGFAFGGLAGFPGPRGTFVDEFVSGRDEFGGGEDAAGEEGGAFEGGREVFAGGF